MYKLKCELYPEICIFNLGVHFENGYFETNNKELYEKLKHYDYVIDESEVEEKPKTTRSKTIK